MSKAEKVFIKLAYDMQDYSAHSKGIHNSYNWTRRGPEFAKRVVKNLDDDRKVFYEVAPGGKTTSDFREGTVADYRKAVSSLAKDKGTEGYISYKLKDDEVKNLSDKTIKNLSIRTKRGPVGRFFLGKYKKQDTSGKSREEILDLVKKT